MAVIANSSRFLSPSLSWPTVTGDTLRPPCYLVNHCSIDRWHIFVLYNLSKSVALDRDR